MGFATATSITGLSIFFSLHPSLFQLIPPKMSHEIILALIEEFSEVLKQVPGTSAAEKKQPDGPKQEKAPSTEKQAQHHTDLPFKKKLENLQKQLDEIKPKISNELPSNLTDQLRDLLYDFHDILEECMASKRADGKESWMSSCNPLKPSSLVSNYCNPFKSSSLSNRLENLEKSLENLKKSTEDESKRMTEGEPRKPDADDKDEESDYEWTTSCIDDTKIYGWEDEVDEIVEELTESKKNFNAVAIAGMYGSGKTALAQKVFMHEDVKDNFPLRLWVCVSPYCSKEELLYRMLDNLGQEADDIQKIVTSAKVVTDKQDAKEKKKSEIGVLLFILYLELLDIKYLIVFDDVRAPLPDVSDYPPASDDADDGLVPDVVQKTDDWHRNLTLEAPEEGEWSDRLAYGLPKENGSAVLVTCRREEDARMMVETGKIFHPKPLDLDNGWKLFERAFNEGKESPKNKPAMKIEYLERMKKQIVDKCNGLPLALIAAGRGLAQLEDDKDRAPAQQENTGGHGSAREEHAEGKSSAKEEQTEGQGSDAEEDAEGHGSASEEHAEGKSSAKEEHTEGHGSDPEEHAEGHGSAPEEHAEGKSSAKEEHTKGHGSDPEENPNEID